MPIAVPARTGQERREHIEGTMPGDSAALPAWHRPRSTAVSAGWRRGDPGDVAPDRSFTPGVGPIPCRAPGQRGEGGQELAHLPRFLQAPIPGVALGHQIFSGPAAPLDYATKRGEAQVVTEGVGGPDNGKEGSRQSETLDLARRRPRAWRAEGRWYEPVLDPDKRGENAAWNRPAFCAPTIWSLVDAQTYVRTLEEEEK